MKATVRVGDVEVQLSGIDITNRQIRDLMRLAGVIAQELPPPVYETQQDSSAYPLGFTAHMDRADSINVLDRFMEDEQ